MNDIYANSPFDKLDMPCLVRVLQHIGPQKQLVACAAVCSNWKKATREALRSIHIQSCSQDPAATEKKFNFVSDQLQQWLGHPSANLYKLSLSASCSASLRLLLSTLQRLSELKLEGVRLEAIPADGSVLRVVDLLPLLQHCTKLTLVASDDAELMTAAAALQAMPALHVLHIKDAGLPEGLVALPTTLTRLHLLHDGDINATNAATFRQLTGLRVLEVSSDSFDTSLLDSCAGLEWLSTDTVCPLSGKDSPDSPARFAAPLLVLARMPSLKHVVFEMAEPYAYQVPAEATAEEVAALSASSKLTYLSLRTCEYRTLPPGAYDTWFPPGRHCPDLEHVDMGEWVMGNTAAVLRMVSACPGLKELKLHSPGTSGDHPGAASVTASLQALTSLTALSCLCIDGAQLPVGVCFSPAVIAAFSQMASLQQLELQVQAEWWPDHMQDVLRLTQLRSLHELSLEECVGGAFFSSSGDMLLTVKSQVGSPPDVWRQLPSALWGVAIERKQKQIRELLKQQQAKCRQQHAAAQSQLMALLQQQETAQAELEDLLEEQRRPDAVMLRQEQQAQIDQLQAQVDQLQAALLECRR